MYRCKLCKKKYRKRHEIRDHIKTKHGIKSEKYDRQTKTKNKGYKGTSPITELHELV